MAQLTQVVVSLRGIKTRGVWQKDLAPELALAGFVPYVLDYGDFGALQNEPTASQDNRTDGRHRLLRSARVDRP